MMCNLFKLIIPKYHSRPIENYTVDSYLNIDTRRLRLLNLEAELLEANYKAEVAAVKLKYEKLRQKAVNEEDSKIRDIHKTFNDSGMKLEIKKEPYKGLSKQVLRMISTDNLTLEEAIQVVKNQLKEANEEEPTIKQTVEAIEHQVKEVLNEKTI